MDRALLRYFIRTLNRDSDLMSFPGYLHSTTVIAIMSLKRYDKMKEKWLRIVAIRESKAENT